MVEAQVKSFQDLLASVTKRVNLLEAASNSKESGASSGLDPAVIEELRASISRMDASVKSTMKTTIQLLDAFKEMQSKSERAIQELSDRVDEVAGPSGAES